MDKALFLLDLLEIGKKKYTLLRQLLLSIQITDGLDGSGSHIVCN